MRVNLPKVGGIKELDKNHVSHLRLHFSANNLKKPRNVQQNRPCNQGPRDAFEVTILSPTSVELTRSRAYSVYIGVDFCGERLLLY